MRRSICVLMLVCIVVAGFSVVADAARRPGKIKVLLITGDDVGAHNWREISETTREILVASKKFDVKVCEDPLILESETALKEYDVIVFTIYARRMPMPPGSGVPVDGIRLGSKTSRSILTYTFFESFCEAFFIHFLFFCIS